MESLYIMVIGSILVETLVEIVKGFFKADKKPNWNLILGAVLGVVICVSCRIDILEYLDIACDIPYLGMVISGLLISRGSNLFHDFMKKITEIAHNGDIEVTEDDEG